MDRKTKQKVQRVLFHFEAGRINSGKAHSRVRDLLTPYLGLERAVEWAESLVGGTWDFSPARVAYGHRKEVR
jgi:hypothetical protein